MNESKLVAAIVLKAVKVAMWAVKAITKCLEKLPGLIEAEIKRDGKANEILIEVDHWLTAERDQAYEAATVMGAVPIDVAVEVSPPKKAILDKWLRVCRRHYHDVGLAEFKALAPAKFKAG